MRRWLQTLGATLGNVMAQILLERYDDFTGGLNLRADQFLLA
jgi:hypothetical protein